MIDPRRSFKDSDHGKNWLDVVDSARFQAAVSAALIQMQLTLPHPPDMGTAAAYHFRMEGAKQFLQILMSLTETTPERRPPSGQNLDHI
jgi:hypothetical protein